jgi:C4-dicarboxylate-specific signal transduction histidine kinase
MKLTGVQSAMITALYPKVREPWMFGFSQCSHARVWTQSEERLFQEIGRRLADALTTLLVLGDLRESARRYQNIFQTAAVAICEQDCSRVRTAIDELRAGGVQDFRRWFAEHPDFVAQTIQMIRIVDVNDATVTLFRAQSKDELVESAHKVLVPETMPLLVEELLAIAEHRASIAAEARLQTLSGDQLDVLFMVAFPPEPTTLDSVLVSLMDVTARKQAEDALRTAHTELARASTLTTMGQLAASIAHELRQPLAAISMNGSATLRWLKRSTPDLAEATDAATRIVQDAHRADEVIRGLRAVMGQSALQREAINATDAIEHVLQLVRGELRRNDVTVQLDLAPALAPVLGDRVQLQQVLLNLIMNAIEAMAPVSERPKSLIIRTEGGEAGKVVVTIDDTGPGLEPTTVERIFDPFFTTKPNGLGMGLSICRSIVEAHGGHLWASPRSPHGTTFRFSVPTIRPPLDDVPAATERGAAAQ